MVGIGFLENWKMMFRIFRGVFIFSGSRDSFFRDTPHFTPQVLIISSRKTHGFVGETHHFRKHPYVGGSGQKNYRKALKALVPGLG